jgi:hypothetical protein
MKRAFQVIDLQGEQHQHSLFLNSDRTSKDFVSPGEVITTINDHNRDVKNNLKGRDAKPFEGSFIISEVYTF